MTKLCTKRWCGIIQTHRSEHNRMDILKNVGWIRLHELWNTIRGRNWPLFSCTVLYSIPIMKKQASHYLLNKHHYKVMIVHIFFDHFIIIEALSSCCFGWMAGLCCFFQLQAHIKYPKLVVTTRQQQQSRITNSKAQTCGLFRSKPKGRLKRVVSSLPPVHRHQHVRQM